MRKHDRFDSGIPILISRTDVAGEASAPLVNIGVGGLSCYFATPVTIGDSIKIHITATEPNCELSGKIKWCRKFGDHFEIGLEFDQKNDPFLTNMVEQICRIEQYRLKVSQEEGRELSSEEAASEWIEKFADDFRNKNN